MPSIIILYAGILGLMAVVLAAPAGLLRGKLGVSVGDGGNMGLLLAMRRHGNFAESVPILLIIIGFLEMNGVSGTAIHAMGGILVLARVAHAMGLKEDIQNPLRGIGAGATALLTVVASIWAIVVYLS
ncbi:MAG: MAPEG family protein [Pseudomonadales bacterium]